MFYDPLSLVLLPFFVEKPNGHQMTLVHFKIELFFIRKNRFEFEILVNIGDSCSKLYFLAKGAMSTRAVFKSVTSNDQLKLAVTTGA